MAELKFHPVANIFPMMEGEDFDHLVDDIKSNGLLEPIWTYEGKILDGRNRYMACRSIGIEPKFREYKGNDPAGFVLSLNLERRHLTPTQRAFIALDLVPYYEQAAKERQRQGQSKVTDPNQLGNARDFAAAKVHVSSGYVAYAGEVQEADEAIAAEARAGLIHMKEAMREVKRSKKIAELEDISALETKVINGVYDVIVIDPPWSMEKIERDVRQNQVAFEYPTMELEEIGALQIPCTDDCHVFLWTTQRFLPSAFKLFDLWKLKYVCTFNWHKKGGFQVVGLPQYNNEFILYGRKGTPVFIDTTDFKTSFEGKRGAHSAKPEEFYETLRRVTAGRRLDMFSRRVISGFDGWGKEAK